MKIGDMSRVVTSLMEYPDFNSGNPEPNSGRRSHSGMNIDNVFLDSFNLRMFHIFLYKWNLLSCKHPWRLAFIKSFYKYRNNSDKCSASFKCPHIISSHQLIKLNKRPKGAFVWKSWCYSKVLVSYLKVILCYLVSFGVI